MITKKKKEVPNLQKCKSKPAHFGPHFKHGAPDPLSCPSLC